MQLVKYITLLVFIAIVISGNFNSATAEEIPAEQMKPKKLLAEGTGEISEKKVKDVLYYVIAKEKFKKLASEYNYDDIQESDKLKNLEAKLKELHKQITDRVEFDLIFMKLERFDNPYTCKKLRAFLAQHQSKKYGLKGLLIRGPNEVAQIGDTPKKNIKKASSAKISVSRDLSEGKNAWQFRGSLLYPLSFESPKEENSSKNNEDKTGPPRTQNYFLPGVRFDRQDYGEDSKKNVDTLSFFFGNIATVTDYQDDSWLPAQYFRFFTIWTTDFSLESKILSVRFQWQPIPDLSGSKIQASLGQLLDFRFEFYLDTWAGYVFSAGDKADLVEDDEFLRVGPGFHLEIWPWPNLLSPWLKFDAKWNYLTAIAGDPGSVDLLELAAILQLNESGQFTLEPTYRTGRLLDSLDRVNTISLELGMKF